MSHRIKIYKHSLIYKIFIILILCSFTLLSIVPSEALAQGVFSLPAPGTAISLSPAFVPINLRGIVVDPENPFEFDFIVDAGDVQYEGEDFNREAERLIRYFLASLTMPEDDLWVNLSPYEQDRIIPESFGQTEMGIDLLAQDYLLKQITASLINPDVEPGKEFWAAVYKKTYEQFGTTNVGTDTFNKVWIMPEKAVIYENEGRMFIVESSLNVMLEEDYVALANARDSGIGYRSLNIEKRTPNADNNLASNIMREVIIPELEREVNQGKNFANLRQIYHSLILATWFKETLKDSIINQVYSDQKKVMGLEGESLETLNVKRETNDVSRDTLHASQDTNDQIPDTVQIIYQQYLEAFKQGVVSMIRVEYDPYTRKNIPRKYFSGGFKWKVSSSVIVRTRKLVDDFSAKLRNIRVRLQSLATSKRPLGENDPPPVLVRNNINFSYHPKLEAVNLRHFIDSLLSLVPDEILRESIKSFAFGGRVPSALRPDVGAYLIQEKKVIIDGDAIQYVDLIGLARLILHEIGHGVEKNFSGNEKKIVTEFFQVIQERIEGGFSSYQLLLPGDETNILNPLAKESIQLYLKGRDPSQFLAEFFRQYVLNAEELRESIEQEKDSQTREGLGQIYRIFKEKVGKEFSNTDKTLFYQVLGNAKDEVAKKMKHDFDQVVKLGLPMAEEVFYSHYGISFSDYKNLHELALKHGLKHPSYDMVITPWLIQGSQELSDQGLASSNDYLSSYVDPARVGSSSIPGNILETFKKVFSLEKKRVLYLEKYGVLLPLSRTNNPEIFKEAVFFIQQLIRNPDFDRNFQYGKEVVEGRIVLSKLKQIIDLYEKIQSDPSHSQQYSAEFISQILTYLEFVLRFKETHNIEVTGHFPYELIRYMSRALDRLPEWLTNTVGVPIEMQHTRFGDDIGGEAGIKTRHGIRVNANFDSLEFFFHSIFHEFFHKFSLSRNKEGYPILSVPVWKQIARSIGFSKVVIRENNEEKVVDLDDLSDDFRKFREIQDGQWIYKEPGGGLSCYFSDQEAINMSDERIEFYRVNGIQIKAYRNNDVFDREYWRITPFEAVAEIGAMMLMGDSIPEKLLEAKKILEDTLLVVVNQQGQAYRYHYWIDGKDKNLHLINEAEIQRLKDTYPALWRKWRADSRPLNQASGDPDGLIKGGIDFTYGNLEIERQGISNSIQLNIHDLHNFEIEGLYPVIINVTPITNLPLLLGAHEEQNAYQLSLIESRR